MTKRIRPEKNVCLENYDQGKLTKTTNEHVL